MTSVITSPLRHHRLRRTDASAQCESCSIYFVMTRVSLRLPYSSRSSIVASLAWPSGPIRKLISEPCLVPRPVRTAGTQ